MSPGYWPGKVLALLRDGVGNALESAIDAYGTRRLQVNTGGIVDAFGSHAFHSFFGDVVTAKRNDVLNVVFAHGILPTDLSLWERWDLTTIVGGPFTVGEVVSSSGGGLAVVLVATTPMQTRALSGILGDLETITGRDSGATATINRGNHGTVTADASRLMVQSGTDTDTDISATSRRVISYTAGHDLFCEFTAGWLDGGIAGTDQYMIFGHDEDGYGIGYNGVTWGAIHRRDGATDFTPRSSFTIDTLDGSGDENNPSGYDITAKHAFLVPFGMRVGYLGVIGVAMFLRDDQNNRWIPFHRHTYGGVSADVVVLDPRFQLRAEIKKTAAAATNVRMIGGSWNGGVVGGSLIRRHHYESTTYSYVKPGDKPAFAIRNKTTAFGVPQRAPLRLTILGVAHDGTKPLRARVWKNANLAGGSWVDHDSTDSVVEIRTPTSFTEGEPATALGLGQATGDAQDITSQEKLLYPGETFVISVESTQNAIVDIDIHWEEHP